MSRDEALWRPLPRDEVIKAVERRAPARIPLVEAHLWDNDVDNLYADRIDELHQYREDKLTLWLTPIDTEAMDLSWEHTPSAALDNNGILGDWGQLDEFIAKLPDPDRDAQFDELQARADQARSQDLYMLFGWWGVFFERAWGLRGMQNFLTDVHLEKKNVHRLLAALCDLQCAYIRRAAREFAPDGFWTSDDLGHQTQPMMSPGIFDEMLKPYYDQIGRTLREANMHWWLHSCGNNTPLLPSLIDAGVDVLHPIQKHAMDETFIAREYGDRISFLVGIDVQRLLREGSPDDVRAEVRHLIDTFDRPDGGMCMAAGNVIVHPTPFENIKAFLDESLHYGAQHRRRFA